MPFIDAQWARIEPLLPDRTPKRGGRWRDHREVIDAIAYLPVVCPMIQTKPPGRGGTAACGRPWRPQAGNGEGPAAVALARSLDRG
ncbi:transposase [Streptomyces bluensis]|uniref:transposase n=1 Tax=Streptomyces bluensis TaxID=33897 RepID=UPI0036B8489D